MTPEDLCGVARLLILQPTAFCNIDCDYCYLPNRRDKRVMSHDVVEAAVRFVFENGLDASDVTVVWHAGEPLLVPPDWYREAFRRVDAATPPGKRLPHAVQTNGMLIDEAWCALFLEHDVRVGVSIDGPAFLHDARRRTRAGKGTHAAALRGLRLLKEKGVACHVICVVTDAALSHAPEIVSFFHAEGVHDLGFNIEEVEGPNTRTSLARPGVVEDFHRFFDKAVATAEHLTPSLRVREHASMLDMLLHPGFGQLNANSQNMPMAMITVGVGGELFTFSPELAGLRHETYGDFAIGQLPGVTLADVLAHPGFRQQLADIAKGVDLCKRSCAYFDICLGGSPVNKLAECGSFAATETLFCKLAQQVVADVALARLERRLDALQVAV